MKTKTNNAQVDKVNIEQPTEKELKRLLKLAVQTTLTKRKTINNFASSYGLKHVFERYLGFYISNQMMKEVMNELKFKAVSDGVNERYAFSQKTNLVLKIEVSYLHYKRLKAGKALTYDELCHVVRNNHTGKPLSELIDIPNELKAHFKKHQSSRLYGE
jgi:hypothetical protein